MATPARTARPNRPTAGVAGIVGVCTLLIGARPAFAQPTVPYEEVDPGRADASALNDSLRLVPIDLRTPTGFDRVFRLPTVVGGAVFARMDGGLTAVFPRSEYDPGGPVIPAGTTWYIGALPTSVFGVGRDRPRGVFHNRIPRGGVARTSTSRLELRLDTSADPISLPDGFETALRPVRNPLMPWSGELERGARVSDLLHRAARASP